MVDMLLNGILEVDEKKQTFTCFVTASTSWDSDILQWRPKEVCGLRRISIQREKLWIPDIVILEDIGNSGVSIYNQYALVFHFGLLQVVDRYELTTACRMDLYRFPFDTQICSITFQSVLNTVHEVRLRSYFNQSTMNHHTREVFTSLGEWELVGINITVEQYNIGLTAWDQLKYMIILERRPLLYVINLVIPITFLLVLDVASFCISEARGEKLGFKVTILLSISVLLLILQDILPSTGDRLPLMAFYCSVIFTLTGLSLLETMVVSLLVNLDDCVEKDMDALETGDLAESQKEVENCEDPGRQGEPARAVDISLETKENEPNISGGDAHRRMTLQKLLISIFKPGKKKPRYYKEVAKKIDIVYFCLYFIFVIAFMAYTFNEWVH
uniref:Uncharacterized protein n=2 Tax=Myripristis murdjan TaxID=586833 RepID=A0A667X408_9TELE